MRGTAIAWSLSGWIMLAACGGDSGTGGAMSAPNAPPSSVSSPAVPNTGDPGAGGSAQPPGSGQAGQAAPTDTSPGSPQVAEPPEAGAGAPPVAEPEPGLALDECGLDTGFPGDEYCILPPPPDKGFQVRIGPADYANPGRYLMRPGEESTEDFPAVSGNQGQIYFYYRQYRMRPGSHHLIVSQTSGGLGAGGRRLGGSQNVAKDNPDRGVIAPENEGIGMPLDARTPINVQLHYINTGTEPVLREAWINFWYVDPATVTQQAKEMFANGGLGMNVPAGAHTVLGPYSCAISQPGRVLTMYGHRHANAPRFSAWRVRGGVRELVYESLDWAEPMVLEFNTITTNPAPDRQRGLEGGFSGILDLMPGDALEWECEVQNQHSFPLRFGNQTYDSEMCILIGDTVGPSVACQHL
jgi:hypothetical protein